jgi:hypothetical protein
VTDTSAPLDRPAIHDDLERARQAFHAMVNTASPADLRRGTSGTRWTNGQLLFHMLFGYLLVRRLRVVILLFTRLPDQADLAFASGLNAAARPFHVINYLGSCGGSLVFHGRRLTAELDRTVAALHLDLELESEEALRSRMAFPTRWDPFFADTMSLADVYRYGTQHFDFHRRQLTLVDVDASGP